MWGFSWQQCWRTKASSDLLPFCTYLKDFHQVFSSTLLSYPSPTVLRSIPSLSWTGAQFSTALLDRHIWKKMDGSNFNKVSFARIFIQIEDVASIKRLLCVSAVFVVRSLQSNGAWTTLLLSMLVTSYCRLYLRVVRVQLVTLFLLLVSSFYWQNLTFL